jgi:cytidylate kinase
MRKLEDTKLKYRNVTISGKVATGTSTLFYGLKPYLEPHGWRFFSGGEFMREYAIEKGLFPKNETKHHHAGVYSDEFDKKVDYGMQDRLEKKNKQVFEAWLAGFMARGIDGILKVLLVCSDDAVLIDRVVNRDKVSVEEAKEHIRDRAQKNIAKWKRLYGDYDFYDPKEYDLVIDTFAHGPHETLGKVLDKLGYPVNNK